MTPNITCPYCGAIHQNGNNFCTGCGKQLNQNRSSFCTNCGAAMPKGVNFCQNCGTKATSNDTQNQKQPESVTLSDGHKIAKVPGKKRQIASLEGYWDKLREEWENAPEEGYVYTIHIDQVVTANILFLAKVNYHLSLSCSHVGKSPLGIYSGELAMEYDADLKGTQAILMLTGGLATYDADGWFKNKKFLMKVDAYDQAEDDFFPETFGPLPLEDPAAEALKNTIVNAAVGNAGSKDQPFEKTNTPIGAWYDWHFRMTEGDMSGYLKMAGIVWGTTYGHGTVDASGTKLQGQARTTVPFFGTYSERYAETVESPFPYSLKIYGNNQVVFELHSSNGGPMTIKFYGTIDKIPVENTIKR